MPNINTRSDFDDVCTCGHVRGEHLIRTGEMWVNDYCLITGCHCPKFDLVSADGKEDSHHSSAREP